jgi:hypothetical protein
MSTLDLQEIFQHCPYCGEQISILVDPSVPSQHYIEDCEVCCRPITVMIEYDDEGNPALGLLAENDVG